MGQRNHSGYLSTVFFVDDQGALHQRCAFLWAFPNAPGSRKGVWVWSSLGKSILRASCHCMSPIKLSILSLLSLLSHDIIISWHVGVTPAHPNNDQSTQSTALNKPTRRHRTGSNCRWRSPSGSCKLPRIARLRSPGSDRPARGWASTRADRRSEFGR